MEYYAAIKRNGIMKFVAGGRKNYSERGSLGPERQMAHIHSHMWMLALNLWIGVPFIQFFFNNAIGVWLLSPHLFQYAPLNHIYMHIHACTHIHRHVYIHIYEYAPFVFLPLLLK